VEFTKLQESKYVMKGFALAYTANYQELFNAELKTLIERLKKKGYSRADVEGGLRVMDRVGKEVIRDMRWLDKSRFPVVVEFDDSKRVTVEELAAALADVNLDIAKGHPEMLKYRPVLPRDCDKKHPVAEQDEAGHSRSMSSRKCTDTQSDNARSGEHGHERQQHTEPHYLDPHSSLFMNEGATREQMETLWVEKESKRCAQAIRQSEKKVAARCPSCSSSMQWTTWRAHRSHGEGWGCNNIETCGAYGSPNDARWCCTECEMDFCEKCCAANQVDGAPIATPMKIDFQVHKNLKSYLATRPIENFENGDSIMERTETAAAWDEAVDVAADIRHEQKEMRHDRQLDTMKTAVRDQKEYNEELRQQLREFGLDPCSGSPRKRQPRKAVLPTSRVQLGDIACRPEPELMVRARHAQKAEADAKEATRQQRRAARVEIDADDHPNGTDSSDFTTLTPANDEWTTATRRQDDALLQSPIENSADNIDSRPFPARPANVSDIQALVEELAAEIYMEDDGGESISDEDIPSVSGALSEWSMPSPGGSRSVRSGRSIRSARSARSSKSVRSIRSARTARSERGMGGGKFGIVSWLFS